MVVPAFRASAKYVERTDNSNPFWPARTRPANSVSRVVRRLEPSTFVLSQGIECQDQSFSYEWVHYYRISTLDALRASEKGGARGDP